MSETKEAESPVNGESTQQPNKKDKVRKVNQLLAALRCFYADIQCHLRPSHPDY